MKYFSQIIFILFILLMFQSLWAADQFISEYTSLSDCKILRSPGPPKKHDPIHNDGNLYACHPERQRRIPLANSLPRTGSFTTLRFAQDDTCAITYDVMYRIQSKDANELFS